MVIMKVTMKIINIVTCYSKKLYWKQHTFFSINESDNKTTNECTKNMLKIATRLTKWLGWFEKIY
jgi:hypothetical protein